MRTLNSKLNSVSNFIAEVCDSHVQFVIVGPRLIDSNHSHDAMPSRGSRTGTRCPGQYRKRYQFSQANLYHQPLNRVA